MGSWGKAATQAAPRLRPCECTSLFPPNLQDENYLISSRSRAASVAVSDINMYYLNSFYPACLDPVLRVHSH